MVNGTTRVALYLRRSTEEHQAASLDVQEGEARRFLAKLGAHTLAREHVFVDSGVSRAEFAKRPGLIALLRAVESREVDVVVTRDETRLGGDMVRVSLLIQDMLDAGARLYYYFTGEEVQINDAVSKFMVTARNFAAELEREKISQRTHEHLLVKARKGLNVGGRVYGYDNVEVMDGERRKHVEYAVNAEQSAVIVEIFTRYARGEGLRTIAKALNARRVPSPRAGKRGSGSWAPSALFSILRRMRYAGIVEWNKMEKTYRKGTKVRVERDAGELVRVEAPHLRVISDDLWMAAHAQMRAKKPITGEPVERKKGGRPAAYLLSGITKCGVCGGALSVISGRDGMRPIKVYVCSYRHDRGDTVCTNRHRRPVDALNAGVVNWIKTNILSDELVLDSLKEVKRRMAEREKSVDKDVPRLEAQAHKLRAQIANIVDVVAETPKAKTEALIKGMSERQDELNEVETRLRAIKAAPLAIKLEIRRLEVEARARLEQLQDALERNPKEARAI
ncbi:MAG: recombinase family protein, partial [Polyangiaceae bacterium]